MFSRVKRKSNTGCQRCKKRHVKCDEAVPCTACVRHRFQCSLEFEEPPPKRRGQSTKLEAARPRPTLPDVAARFGRAIAPFPSNRPDVAAAPARVNAWPALYPHKNNLTPSLGVPLVFVAVGMEPIHARLLQNWASSTCLTLPQAASVPDLWRVDIPELARNFPYLMHLMLAISAYHMAHLQPDAHAVYEREGARHLDTAVQSLKAAIDAFHEDTIHAVFAAGTLLHIGLFAKGATRHRFGGRADLDDLIEVFNLIRGLTNVLFTFRESLEQGIMGQLIMLSTGAMGAESALDKIAQRLMQRVSVDQLAATTSDVVCHSAAAGLFACINHAVAKTASPETRVVFSWACRIDDGFMSLVRARNPAALVIVSYYCVIIHAATSAHFFLMGWGPDVLRQSMEIVGPDQWDNFEWQAAHVTGTLLGM